MIIKKKLLLLALILIFIPLVYAFNYGEGTYGFGRYGIGEVTSRYCGDRICNNGETCSTCPKDCGTCPISPGGGSSGGGASCTYDWECTNWIPQECPVSGIQERVCINRGTCTGTADMPVLTRNCTYEHKEPLFDIFLTLDENYKEMCSDDKIKAKIRLENFGKVELLDAFMTYWIIDENNNLITELKDTRAVTQDKDIEVDLNIPKLTSQGTYRIYAEITYDTNKTALAGESFEILSEEECELLAKKKFNWLYPLFAIAIILIVVLLAIIFYLRKRKKCSSQKPAKQKTHSDYKRKVRNRLKNIRTKHYLLFAISLIALTTILSLGTTVTGNAILQESNTSTNLIILGIILLVVLVSLSIYLYKKDVLNKLKEKLATYPDNSTRGLIKKKVYTINGDYLGKIKEVYLKNNIIDSLKIKLDKKYKTKGIIISYKNVDTTKKIVLVNNKILEKLNKD